MSVTDRADAVADPRSRSAPPGAGYGLACAVLVVLVAVLPAFHRDLWNPDEPRVAHLAWAMLESGDWIVPRVNGEPFVEQPPLQAWLVALGLVTFGMERLEPTNFGGDQAARVPSMLFALGVLVLTFRAGRRLGASPGRGLRVGLLAVIGLATTVEFFSGFQEAIVDTSLAFFVTVGMLQLLELELGERPALGRFALLGLAAGASFMAKNLIGIAFLGLVALALVIEHRDRLLSRRALLGWLVSVLVAALVVTPWLVAFGLRRPDLLGELLIANTIGRFTSQGVHNPPLLEFLHRAIAALSPWILVAAPAIFTGVRDVVRRRSALSRALPVTLPRTLLWWTLLPLCLVLASGSKREVYLLPITPAVALAAALWLEPRLGSRPVRIVAVVLGVVIAIAVPLGALGAGAIAGALTTAFWIGVGLHAAIGYRWLRGRGRFAGESPAWALGLLLVSGLLCGGIIFFQARNERESYVALSRHLVGYRERDFEVVGYRLPLREISAIPYYLGEPIENIDEPGELAVRFTGERPVVVVLRASLEAEVLDRVGPFFDAGEYRVRRRIRVLANRARGDQ